MKQNELLIRRDGLEPIEDKHELDLAIEKTIEQYKQNSSQIARLTVDSVTSLAVAEARTNELENQGFMKRAFNNLTGKNKKLKSSISYSQRKAQYAAQQTLSKLAEQNLLTFDVLTAVNSKLNAYIISNSKEMNELYSILLQFIKETRGSLLRAENQFNHLNQRIELLRWAQTIEYATFEGANYTELDIPQKMFCLVSDFYILSKGEWDTTDLLLIKSILKDLEVDSSGLIDFENVLEAFIHSHTTQEMMKNLVDMDKLRYFSPLEVPLIYGIYKANSLVNQERYIVKTLLENIDTPLESKSDFILIKELSSNYILTTAYRNPKIEQSIFELINELLLEIKVINNVIIDEPEPLLITESEKDKSSGEYEVIILDYTVDKFEVSSKLSILLEIDIQDAYNMLSGDELLCRIATGLSQVEAERLVNELNGSTISAISNLIKSPIKIVYIDSKQLEPTNTYRNDNIFSIRSDAVQSQLECLEFNVGTVITPYSIVGGRHESLNLNLIMAEVSGKIVRVFNEPQAIEILEQSDSYSDESRIKYIPLFAVQYIKSDKHEIEKMKIGQKEDVFYRPQGLNEIYLNLCTVLDF